MAKNTEDCAGCWWKEGGRCYVEPCDVDANGRSLKPASERCGQYLGKRHVLSQVIPNGKLVITSEGTRVPPESA